MGSTNGGRVAGGKGGRRWLPATRHVESLEHVMEGMARLHHEASEDQELARLISDRLRARASRRVAIAQSLRRGMEILSGAQFEAHSTRWDGTCRRASDRRRERAS